MKCLGFIRLGRASRQPLCDAHWDHHARKEERSDGGHSRHAHRQRAARDGQVKRASECRMRRSRGIESLVRFRPFSGSHVVLWSLSCAPVVFVLSFITLFYYGTLTWYNIFLVYNEERTFCHKITVCPFLIIFYPRAHRAAVAVAELVLGRGAGVLGLRRMVAVGQGSGEGFLRMGLWEARIGGLFSVQRSRAAGLGHHFWESAWKVAANILGVNGNHPRFSLMVIQP